MKRVKLLPIAMMLLLASCGSKQETTEAKELVYPVNVMQATSEMVDQSYNFTTTVEPFKRNSIAPQQPGRIRSIFVEVGDNVRKGQKLAQMDAASLSQQKSQLDNLEIEYTRMKELFAVGGASKQQLDQIQTQYDMAKELYTQLVENTELLAPIDGIVTARNYDDGDLYSSQQPILTVMQIQPVKLMINVPEQLYTQVRKGMSVNIKVNVFGDENFIGKVNLIYPTIDASTRTFAVEVLLPNADRRVRPGMYGSLELSTESIERVVLSDRAVRKQSGSNERYVFVVDAGKAVYRSVTIGRRLGNQYEIISGVEPGEQVITNGATKLVNGSLIEIKK
ncbi:MAG: efflux RND transporter periplasmic adaptor subunit [Bacteroidales bacterium]